jgi:hypothetical protein
MSKREEQRLQALAKKNAAKAAQPTRADRRRQYDDTLPSDKGDDKDLRDFFSEMKKREF